MKRPQAPNNRWINCGLPYDWENRTGDPKQDLAIARERGEVPGFWRTHGPEMLICSIALGAVYGLMRAATP